MNPKASLICLHVPEDVAANQSYAHLLARGIVRPLVGTWVRPNHLTGLRALIGIAACVLLGIGGARAGGWSGVLWAMTCLLDRADGELARIGNLRSDQGRVFDFYSDLVLDAGWFLGAGIGIRHGLLGDAAPWIGAFTCLALVCAIWYAEIYERLSPPGVKAWAGVQRFHPDDALFLLAPLTWIGWVTPLLLAASVCTPIIAVVMFRRCVAVRQSRTRRS